MNSHFWPFCFQNDEKVVLYPEVNCSQKLKKGGSTKIWPPEAQVWTIQKVNWFKSVPNY